MSSKKLIIEIDGSQHFEKDTRKYDSVRSNYFKGLNIKVLRFTNTKINNNIDSVIQEIMSELFPLPLTKGRIKEGSLKTTWLSPYFIYYAINILYNI